MIAWNNTILILNKETNETDNQIKAAPLANEVRAYTLLRNMRFISVKYNLCGVMRS